MSYVFLIEQMTMTIRLLATGCFVHAQVKVEHPVTYATCAFKRAISSCDKCDMCVLSRQNPGLRLVEKGQQRYKLSFYYLG